MCSQTQTINHIYSLQAGELWGYFCKHIVLQRGTSPRGFFSVIYGVLFFWLILFTFIVFCFVYVNPLFHFQVIYIKESNVIAPYRNERVSPLCYIIASVKFCNDCLKTLKYIFRTRFWNQCVLLFKRNSVLFLNKLVRSQEEKTLTFQLEVWSKTEDVVQTLLQVCRWYRTKYCGVGVGGWVLCHMCVVCCFHSLQNLLNFAAPQGLLSGKTWRPDCNGKSIITLSPQ